MDKKTTITVGRSVQVFQIGMPEQWLKFGIEKDFPEDVNIQQAVSDLMFEVNTAVDKFSPQQPMTHPPTGDLYFNVTKNREERG